jgi:NADPH-dependent 2,4-dienoyl-CoA reductase/sulfur reductase-like enzyme
MTDQTRCEFLVIGGGPAAHAALGAYRDHDGAQPVVLATDEDALPYRRPSLTKDFLRGEASETDLPLAGPDWYDGIDVRRASPVVALDPRNRTAVLHNGHTIRYRTALLATGSRPLPLPVPGGDRPEVRLLRSLDDGRRLRAAAGSATTAIVLGSGFIGAEAAVSLARRGLAVTLVSRESQPQITRLGAPAGERFAGWLRAEGVELVLGVDIEAIGPDRTVLVSGGRRLTADLVLSGGGVTPRADLAEAAGVPVRDGRVIVDAHMRSRAPGLLAAGDVALADNAAAGRPLPVEHWGEAERMGQVAGAVAAGGIDSWYAVPGFWTQLGDRTVKHLAWGDGFDDVRLGPDEPERFTVWYGRRGVLVGALTFNQDKDYERAERLIVEPVPLASV